MKNVLKTSLALLFLISSISINAQTIEKEVGLILNNLSDFGIVFKKQTKENSYLQLNVLNMTSTVQNDDFGNGYNFGAGLSVGFEKRKPISEKLFFMHGFQPFLFVNYSGDSESDLFNYNINPGLGYMLGFILNAGKNVRIGLQTAPNINFSFRRDNTEPVTESFRYGFGLGNFNSSLTITYVFEKENG